MKGIMAVVVGVAVLAGGAQAQEFPSKPVRFIVPFPPGGGTDAFSRLLAEKLAEVWGQQVPVDNRGGAQGNIGTALGAKAPADGYTITFANNGTLTINPHLYGNTGYDSLRDFAAVARGTEEYWSILVNPALPVQNLKELIAYAKQNPARLNYASPGAVGQLLAENFKIKSGTEIVHVPYAGAGPATADLISGRVQMLFATAGGLMAQIKAGKVKALTILGTKRTEALPDMPSVVEAGYPEFALGGWYGIIVPAATPRDIVQRLNGSIVRAINSPDLNKRLRTAGQTPAPSSSEEFRDQIRNDFERWGQIVKITGAKVD